MTPRVLPDVLPTLKPFHPDEEGLLRACLEVPEDDAPRLILADWYEEHGLVEFSDYIRYEVTRRFDQETKSPPEQVDKWALDHIPDYRTFSRNNSSFVIQIQFSRGLPSRCALDNLSIDNCRAHLGNYRAWLTDLVCYGSMENEHGWLADDWVRGLRSLALGRIRSDYVNPRESVYSANFFTLLSVGLQTLGHLRTFKLWGTELNDEAAAPLLGTFPCSLIEFDFSDNELSQDFYIRLIQSPMLDLVEKLTINTAKLTDRFCRTLARSTHLKNLKYLYLGWNRITGTGANEILESPHLPNLEYIDVRYNKISRMSRLQLLKQTVNPNVRVNIE